MITLVISGALKLYQLLILKKQQEKRTSVLLNNVAQQVDINLLQPKPKGLERDRMHSWCKSSFRAATQGQQTRLSGTSGLVSKDPQQICRNITDPVHLRQDVRSRAQVTKLVPFPLMRPHHTQQAYSHNKTFLPEPCLRLHHQVQTKMTVSKTPQQHNINIITLLKVCSFHIENYVGQHH